MKHEWSGAYGSVDLCPMTAEDAERQRILRNQNRQWFCFSGEITPEEQGQWFSDYLKRENDYMFSVWIKPENHWIGTVSLYDIDPVGGFAEFGRLLIDRVTAGRSGLGLEATLCACHIGWEQLGLSEIRLEVYEDNVPARRIYERAGFLEYGRCTDTVGRTLIQMILIREERNGDASKNAR